MTAAAVVVVVVVVAVCDSCFSRYFSSWVENFTSIENNLDPREHFPNTPFIITLLRAYAFLHTRWTKLKPTGHWPTRSRQDDC